MTRMPEKAIDTPHRAIYIRLFFFAPEVKGVLSSYSSVAQSVEQVAVNHPVGGSSPSRGAKKINEARFVTVEPRFSYRGVAQPG